MVWVHLKWVGRQLQTTFYFRPSQYTLLLYLFLTFFLSVIPFVSDVKKAKTEKVATKTSSKEGASGGPKDKTPNPLSIQKDPKTSATYKSLFTSSNKAKNQQSAHWVTYNPFYNWLLILITIARDYKSRSLKTFSKTFCFNEIEFCQAMCMYILSNKVNIVTFLLYFSIT